ncbi:hypothetical protein [Micromonospora aurantiaca (nom. illeg.)]|uniref:hypothetical protein n=1 Tax=Micromonospora aurantiaca (nom. illeg.) TaxID=47850 RepID=UPI003F4A5339
MSREMSYAETVRKQEQIRQIAALKELSRQLIYRMAAGEELFPAEADEQYQARMAHNARVRAYNARVLAERERVARERQARENAREVAAVRKRLCDGCFCELPASGVCGNC